MNFLLLGFEEGICLDLKTFVKASDQPASHIFAIVVVVVVWDNSKVTWSRPKFKVNGLEHAGQKRRLVNPWQNIYIFAITMVPSSVRTNIT